VDTAIYKGCGNWYCNTPLYTSPIYTDCIKKLSTKLGGETMKANENWHEQEQGRKAKKRSWNGEMEDDDDIYFSDEYRDSLLDDDEISAAEAGFLEGYESA